MIYEVIIPAAGQGKRMKAGKNKLFLELDGIPVLIHTLKYLNKIETVLGIILAMNHLKKKDFQELIETSMESRKSIEIVHGGKERQYSVYNGVKAVTR